MTIKQAINILSSDTSFEAVKELQYYAGFDKDKVVEQIQEAMNMGAEALEKQIPKKPIIQKMKILDCIDQIQIFNKKICPSCGTVLCADWNFCFECGQKLDWE